MDWGKTGHRVVGKLAQQYLTIKAQKEIDILLDGASLVSISTYGDEIKSNPKYKALQPWHYINLPLDESYANAKKNPKGDVVMAIKKCIVKVKDQNEPKNERAFYLKLLVHFIGDLHQPMHVGRKEDRGGNSIRLQWFGKTSNLHRLWDSHLIDSHGMNATQLLGGLEELSPKLIKEIQNQSLEQWVNESQALAKTIYENTPPTASWKRNTNPDICPYLKYSYKEGDCVWPVS